MTRTNPIGNDAHPFPWKQVCILALCRVAEPIAMCSIFPYVYPQVSSFLPNGEQSNNVGLYTGLVIAAFAFAQALTSVGWGTLSDRYGRKPCLILGLLGTLISLQIYGFAENLWVAVLGRALGGILNGNVGVMQTMVAEVAPRKEHQATAFSVLPIVWAIGSIIGPAIGGGLVEPAKTWPSLFPAGSFLDRYPWALPNIACGVMVFISIILALLWLEETNPAAKVKGDVAAKLCSKVFRRRSSLKPHRNSNADDERQSLLAGSNNSVSYDATPNSPLETPALEYFDEKRQESVYTTQVIFWIAAYGILSYHANTFEHLLPILLQTEPTTSKQWALLRPSGLGFSSQLVGALYGAQGVFGMFVQFLLFPKLVKWFGNLNVYVWGTITYPILYFVTPYMVLVPGPWYWIPVGLILIFKMFWECCVFPVLFILLTNSVQNPQRMGTVNGIAASVAALTKAIGPGLSGWIYDWGVAHGTITAAWFICGFVALAGAMLCGWLQDCNHEEVKETLFVDEQAEATAAAMAIPNAVRIEGGQATHGVALLATSLQQNEEFGGSFKDHHYGVSARELRYESDSLDDGARQTMRVVIEESEPSESGDETPF